LKEHDFWSRKPQISILEASGKKKNQIAEFFFTYLTFDKRGTARTYLTFDKTVLCRGRLPVRGRAVAKKEVAPEKNGKKKTEKNC